jgi:hypothetical protein
MTRISNIVMFMGTKTNIKQINSCKMQKKILEIKTKINQKIVSFLRFLASNVGQNNIRDS